MKCFKFGRQTKCVCVFGRAESSNRRDMKANEIEYGVAHSKDIAGHVVVANAVETAKPH